MKDPKAPRQMTCRTHRSATYEVLETGGFLRFCTERGRVYWVAQNETGHTSPDCESFRHGCTGANVGSVRLIITPDCADCRRDKGV
jgi:hypothetical protein